MLDPAYLFVSLMISVVGFAIFLYGKKQKRLPQLVIGVTMMGYPYLLSSTLWMMVVAVALCALLWLLTRLGL